MWSRDFAFETTLASRSFAPWIRDLKSREYAFHLVYLWLPSADAAVARVRERVESGGHSVPEETIRHRRRFPLERDRGGVHEMSTDSEKTIDQLFREIRPIERALRRGVREALIRHKKLGQRIVVWKDGEVVWIPPEEIEIPPPDEEETA